MDCYRFGRFDLLPTERRLLVDGHPAALGQRAFDVLLALVDRAGELVSKDELIERVWPTVIVEENNLQAQISALRKVLGPDAITTIAGHGYRFTARVERAEGFTQAPPQAAPVAAAALYGRADDVARIAGLVAGHSIVSIVGPGGIGKTRVARAIVDVRQSAAGSGIWWVDLAPIADPALVPSAIAQVLRMSFDEARPSAGRIAAEMQGHRGLLVLDNCEHLLASACELAAKVVAVARGVHILATSQEALRVPDEQVYRLAALALPPVDNASFDDARRAPAVELFVARASSSDRRFTLDAATLGDVVHICRHLDGIPLAIELAAARVPLLGIRGVRDRLDERFRVFTAGSRVALPKHQTLRAALEWSHALLSDDERVVLRRIAVFAGSFSLASAQRVACDAAIDEWSVLEHLGGLVDKSLVLAEGAVLPRYRLLETTRLFGQEQQHAAGETQACMRSCALAMIERMEQVENEAWRATSASLYTELEPELDNIRTALAWARGPGGDDALGARLVVSSRWLWETLSLLAEGLDHLRSFEQAAAAVPRLHAAYWRLYVYLITRTGLPLEPADAATRAVDLTRRHDPDLLYDALLASILFEVHAGRMELALRELDELIAQDDESRPPRQRAVRFMVESELHGAAGRLPEARRAQQLRLKYASEAGVLAVVCVAQSELAKYDLIEGDVPRAIDRARRAAADALVPGSRAALNYVNHALAIALIMDDQLDEADTVLRLLLSGRRSWSGQGVVLLPWSLWWARHGDLRRAAVLVASVDALAKRNRRARMTPVETFLRKETQQLVAASLSPAECRRLSVEGASLTEQQAIELATNA
jgi:predicted ATPase/DNA-binding winged helix-turn-helix (wHTH) protein